MFKVQVKSWREEKSLVNQFNKSKEFNPQITSGALPQRQIIGDMQKNQQNNQDMHWGYRVLSSLVYTIPMCSLFGVFSGQMASAAFFAVCSVAFVAVVVHKKELIDDVRIAIQDNRLSA